MKDKRTVIREQAEADLEAFIRLVHPNRVLGSIHSEWISWCTRQEAKNHQCSLLPRDHQKSALMAYRAAWEVTRHPDIRILYVSATSPLAVKQLKFIKDILTSDIYRFYWPEMVNPDIGKREKWTEREISVDHPKRKEENIRDATIFTAGITTSITGFHCDVAILDDLVVIDNAYTAEGREKAEQQYSFLASIEAANAKEWIVGTRYHPKDLYGTLIAKTVEVYNDEGVLISDEPLFEVFERQVENRGDGYGEFLWPKQQRKDGRWFGFDEKILAVKKAQYLDPVQFRAQYYNDPNGYGSEALGRECFQYFERGYLTRADGKWYYKDKRLNVFAAIDFAFSLAKRADYTCIVVVGIDADMNYYVLDIDRFKTDRISDYFDHILALHQKWDFRRIRAEVTAAQYAIVKAIKQDYIQRHGLALIVDDYRPDRSEGTKLERIESTLRPRYENRQMWHYQGGNCQTLEEELVLVKPPHDDIKDCLTSCVEICVAPTASFKASRRSTANEYTHTRFGGIAG